MALTDRQQERIVTDSNWVFVLPATAEGRSGRELRLSGVALDRDVRIQDKSWGITDGSYGIKGYTVKSTDYEEIRLWMSVFIQGIAEQFQEVDVSNTVLGAQPYPAPNSVRNAAISGLSSVLNVYAEDIYDEIKTKGFYTRVPAGEQFYVYVQQTIVPSLAKVGDPNNKDMVVASKSNESGGIGMSPTQISTAVQQNLQDIQRIRSAR